MSKITSSHKCSFCGRGYQRKIYYSRHVAICELMCKSIKERQLENQERDDTPSVRELYDVILEMATKMSAMEKKMNEMSKWVDSKKRKINIIEWLNETHKNIALSMEEFIERIKVERCHLEHLFKEDYNKTILKVIKDVLSDDDENKMPIKAFDIKPNVLFVYTGEGSAPLTPRSPIVNGMGEDGGYIEDNRVADGLRSGRGPHREYIGSDNGGADGLNRGQDSSREYIGSDNRGADGGPPRWIIMPDSLLKQLVNVVMKKLLDEFIVWQKENTGRMEQDDFAIQYANNVRKIMSGGQETYGRVKLDLYKYLRGVSPRQPPPHNNPQYWLNVSIIECIMGDTPVLNKIDCLYNFFIEIYNKINIQCIG